MPFAQPSSGPMFAAKEHVGRLVLFEDIGAPEKIKTAAGESDVIRATVTVVDDPRGPQVYPQSLVFGRVLVGTLARATGATLARLAQGVAKPGQSAPWLLAEFTPADAALAEAYLAARPRTQFAAPVRAQAPQAQAVQTVQAQAPQAQAVQAAPVQAVAHPGVVAAPAPATAEQVQAALAQFGVGATVVDDAPPF